MADSKFQSKLDSFLKSEVIHESDFVTYISMLVDLTKLSERENGFHMYSLVVKNWISGFETIFSESKTKDTSKTFWQTYMSKFSGAITKTYFKLLHSFHQYEPKYTQYFYIKWKVIVSRLNGLHRADSFMTNIDNFKVVIQHLRTAEQRCEQFAVFSVLRLYIECVPIKELGKLIENDNAPIINEIVKLMDNPNIYNQHDFFHNIDALGHCIESLKPTRIVCKHFEMECDNSDYEIWVDFNKKNQSVIFMIISLTDSKHQIFACGGHIKLRESLYDDHILEINGRWTVAICKETPIQKTATVKIFLLNSVDSAISKSVRNNFRFGKPIRSVVGSISHGFTTDYTEREQAKDKNEIVLNESFPSVIPPRFINVERNDGMIPTEPIQPQSFQLTKDMDASWPFSTTNENIEPNEMVSFEQRPINPNLTYSIRQAPKAPHENKATAEERLTDSMNTIHMVSKSIIPNGVAEEASNRTYTIRETVNPIASQQLENDLVNYDAVSMSMDIEDPQNEPFMMNETQVSSGCSFLSNLSAVDVDENDDDILVDESDNEGLNFVYERTDERTVGNRVEILDNITIVSPRSDFASMPMDYYLPRDGTVKFMHFSQVDERISANRKEAFNLFSQPETPRERSFVKPTPVEWRKSNIRRNDVIPTKNEVAPANEMVDEMVMDASVQNIRKRSMTPEMTNASLKKLKSSNDMSVLSTREKSQRTQAPYSLPFEIPSQNHYETFVPLATSTQRHPVSLAEYSETAYESVHQQSVELTYEQRHGGWTIPSATQDIAKSSKMIQKSRNDSQANRTNGVTQINVSDSRAVSPVVKIAAEQQTSTRYPSNEQESLQKHNESVASGDVTTKGQLLSSQVRTKMPESQAQSKIRSQKIKQETAPVATTRNETNIGLSHHRTEIIPSHVQPSSGSRKSSNSPAPSVQRRSENVTIIDLPADVETCQEPVKPSQDQTIRSTSGSQNAIIVSQKRAAVDGNGRNESIKITELPMDTPKAISQQRVKQSKEESNSIQKQVPSTSSRQIGNVTILDLPDFETFRAPLNKSHVRTTMLESRIETDRVSQKSTNPKPTPVTPSVPQLNGTVTNAIEPTDADYQQLPVHSPQKRSKMSDSQVRPISQSGTKSSNKPRMVKQSAIAAQAQKVTTTKRNLNTTVATQTPKKQSSFTRYSSLKRNKAGTIVTRRISKTFKATDSFRKPTDNCTEHSSDGAATDSVIHVDDSGKVYDAKGCVFADDNEVQRAARFYIANNGLKYMTTERFKLQAATKREQYERKLRLIHDMINSGMDGFHKEVEKEKVLDPYVPTLADTLVKGKKRNHGTRYKKVSVTVSQQKSSVDNKTSKAIMTRRVSKLFYIVDQHGAKNSTKCKTTSKEKMNFNKPKTFDTPQPSEKNDNREKEMSAAVPPSHDESSSNHDLPSLEFNKPTGSMTVNCPPSSVPPKKLPIYASTNMKAKHQTNDVPSSTQFDSAAKMPRKRLPIYASRKMVVESQRKLNALMMESFKPGMVDKPFEDVTEHRVEDFDQIRSDVVRKKLPIYESRQMVAESQRKMNESTIEPLSSTDGACLVQEQAKSLKPATVDEPSEDLTKLQARKLCSSNKCCENMEDLVGRLNEIATESLHTCQAICESHRTILTTFIDRLQLQTPTVTDCLKLLNGVLASVETVCDETSEQLKVFHDEVNEQSTSLYKK